MAAIKCYQDKLLIRPTLYLFRHNKSPKINLAGKLCNAVLIHAECFAACGRFPEDTRIGLDIAGSDGLVLRVALKRKMNQSFVRKPHQ